MGEKLKDFLVDLASDPERMKRYAENPDAELDQSGLDAEERAAMASRDPVQLRRALGSGDRAHTMTQVGQRPTYGKTAKKKTAKKKTAKKPKKSRKKA